MSEKGSAVLIAALAVLLVALIVFAVKDEIAWQSYAKQHNCVKTGSKPGYWYTMLMPDGRGGAVPVTQYSGDRSVYKCDNGKVFER